MDLYRIPKSVTNVITDEVHSDESSVLTLNNTLKRSGGSLLAPNDINGHPNHNKSSESLLSSFGHPEGSLPAPFGHPEESLTAPIQQQCTMHGSVSICSGQPNRSAHSVTGNEEHSEKSTHDQNIEFLQAGIWNPGGSLPAPFGNPIGSLLASIQQ